MKKSFRPILFPLATLTAVLFFANAASAQSILLSADEFTVLGGTGITSTGVVGTVIENGNIGLSPGATTGITGFPPAVVENGSIIATGGVTGQARLDIIKAATGLALMDFDVTLSNVDLGGMTLLPGVYKFDAGATLTGALTLDANGQNDAYWVFIIGTSLITAVDSTVTIINPGSDGGSSLGIFWDAGAEITFGANNLIAGNYISGTSITVGAETSGGARLLALAAVTLDNNQIDATGGLNGGDWTGGLTYAADGVNVIAVPEPAASLWLIPLCAVGLTMHRRRASQGQKAA